MIAESSNIHSKNTLTLPAGAYLEDENPNPKLSEYWEMKCDDGTTDFVLWHPKKSIEENLAEINKDFPSLELKKENIKFPSQF